MSDNQNTYQDGLEAAHKALGVLCAAKHAAAQQAIGEQDEMFGIKGTVG